MMNMIIYTIGFTQKTAKQFFNHIHSNGIELLIDIRLNNSSQLAGFTKGADLKYFLSEICHCEYLHCIEFAPTKKILDDYRSKKISWAEYEKQYNEGKQNLETKRKLAELYQKAERHDKAIEFYEMVVKDMGSLDPHIDAAIEKSKVAQMQLIIKQWEEYSAANPNKKAEAEANIQNIKEQILSFRLERALERVNKYPNDLQLRFELANLYWEAGAIDDALQQYQLSQKNPQRRLASIVSIGRCFAEKKTIRPCYRTIY